MSAEELYPIIRAVANSLDGKNLYDMYNKHAKQTVESTLARIDNFFSLAEGPGAKDRNRHVVRVSQVVGAVFGLLAYSAAQSCVSTLTSGMGLGATSGRVLGMAGVVTGEMSLCFWIDSRSTDDDDFEVYRDANIMPALRTALLFQAIFSGHYALGCAFGNIRSSLNIATLAAHFGTLIFAASTALYDQKLSA